jgi:hypothetical protein
MTSWRLAYSGDKANATFKASAPCLSGKESIADIKRDVMVSKF